jgi:hypothetical protein
VTVLQHEEHPVQWVTASPLWDHVLAPGRDATAAERTAMQQPEILRFDNDEFMDEVQALLEQDPVGLANRKATPISFRSRAPGKPVGWTPPIDKLKLYQAAHGDFYLVAASLVCRMPGLPDRLVQPQNGDRVSFVLRREHGAAELAWVDDPAVPKGRKWLELADPALLADGEQLLPLFPLSYPEGDRRRKLFVGLVPTSNGETFKNAGVAALTPDPAQRTKPRNDPRLDELKQKVVDALDGVKLAAAAAVGATRAQRVEASRFVLLDLADLLDRELRPVREAISNHAAPGAGAAAQALYALLESAKAEGTTTWRSALADAWLQADQISGESEQDPTLAVDLAGSTISPSDLTAKLTAALKEHDAATGQPDPTTVEPVQPFAAPKYDLRSATRYTLRCVYQQPQCAPLHADVVSAPSRDFAIASFFDTDAPARPIHITLPFDTSIAALRKSPKNVSLLISNELRAQMDKVADGKKALKGELGSSEELDLGFICSFSIPIITICALIVLMIFISLLNIVFWWMPFFKLCFPVPVLKKSGA